METANRLTIITSEPDRPLEAFIKPDTFVINAYGQISQNGTPFDPEVSEGRARFSPLRFKAFSILCPDHTLNRSGDGLEIKDGRGRVIVYEDASKQVKSALNLSLMMVMSRFYEDPRIVWDGIEYWLSPLRQREIVPQLLRAAQLANKELSFVITTNSPVVMLSLEPHFDRDIDLWYHIGSDDVMREREFFSQGEISDWYCTDVFGFKRPRSLEGEIAIENAHLIMMQQDPPIEDIKDAQKMLEAACLSSMDAFWVRWSYYMDKALKG